MHLFGGIFLISFVYFGRTEVINVRWQMVKIRVNIAWGLVCFQTISYQFKGTITQALIVLKSVEIDNFWTPDMSISIRDMLLSTPDNYPDSVINNDMVSIIDIFERQNGQTATSFN